MDGDRVHRGAGAPLRRVEQRRVQLVSRVLEGHDVDAGDLGYDLAGWHLGLVLGGSGVEEQIEQIAQAWAATVLTVAVETSTLWTWLGCSVAPGPLRDALVALSLPEGTRLAVSEPARGRIGFREAHRQAQVAAALGVERGRSVMAYADVALEDLVMRDTGAAARFAARELGSLADSGREAATLRETLTAYFHAAQRASSAAAALGVHQRTVGNRLRRIEHLLGRPVQERCVELQVALRLFVMQPQHRSTR